MAVLDHPREVSVTEATRRGVAGISDAEAGDIIVTRHHRAVAAVASRAATARPDLLSLAELMATVDRLDADVRPIEPPPDPVPDWLFGQLVHTAGVPPQDVAAMTGEEAFARGNAWMSRPR